MVQNSFEVQLRSSKNMICCDKFISVGLHEGDNITSFDVSMRVDFNNCQPNAMRFQGASQSVKDSDFMSLHVYLDHVDMVDEVNC